MILNWYRGTVLVVLKRILENQVQIKQDIDRLSYACGSLPNESVHRASYEHDIGLIKDINELLGIEN